MKISRLRVSSQKNINEETKLQAAVSKTKQALKKAEHIVKKYGDKASIIEEDGKKFLVIKKTVEKVALNTYKDGVLL